MSSFKFIIQPNDNTTPCPIDFLPKYNGWFQFGYKLKIQSAIDKFINHVNNNEFSELNTELKNIYSNSAVFFSLEDCNQTINIFNKLCKIRRLFQKYIYNKHNSKEEWSIANMEDLEFTKFKSSDRNIIFVPDDKYRRLYAFRIRELIMLYKVSCEFMEDEYPKPIEPKNPYTNSIFTIKQHLTIYNILFKYYCKNNKPIPEIYILFKNSYFNTSLFNDKYNTYLYKRSTRIFVAKLSTKEWIDRMTDFCIDKKGFCFKCFSKLINVRNIFAGILELFILNENDIYSFGDADYEYNIVSEAHNLIMGPNHNIIHSRRIRARLPNNSRGISNNIHIINFPNINFTNEQPSEQENSIELSSSPQPDNISINNEPSICDFNSSIGL